GPPGPVWHTERLVRVAYTLEQCWHRVPGGTARAALELLRAMDARSDVDFVGVSAAHRHPPPPAWTPSIPVRSLPLPRLALYESWHLLRWPPVQRVTGPVEVIHATAMAVPPRTAPLVAQLYDLAFQRFPENYTAKGRRFFGQAMRLLHQDADLLLCPSTATIEDCLAAGFPGAKLRLVPLGVAPVEVDPAVAAEVLARYGLDRPFVLSVGTLEPRKNLPALVEAFARLGRADVDLVLVGAAGWKTKVEDLVRPLGERVRVLGFVPDVDRDALYASAAVFCYPSLFEGFGLPVLEAMAAGAAVITSAGIATAEAAGDAAVLVDPHDVAALSAALGELLADPAAAAELRAAGRARAAAFTWDRSAELTVQAYRELCP
ncbi:MAG: glycosyltransferase family 4 protein, partial [Acidimicrobiales bacterium]